MSELLDLLDEIRRKELGELREQVGYDPQEPSTDEQTNDYIEALENAYIGTLAALKLTGGVADRARLRRVREEAQEVADGLHLRQSRS